MMIFNQLINPMQHCEASVFHLIKLIKVKVTETTLSQKLVEHTNYPSLLSISDILTEFNIYNLALNVSSDDFAKLPVPFIAHFKSKTLDHDLFVIVENVSENSIEFYNPENRKVQNASIEEFSSLYEGTVLVVEKLQDAGENNYSKIRREQREKFVKYFIGFISLPFITLLACAVAIFNQGIYAITSVQFSLITLAGCFIGLILLLREIDRHNPLVEKICYTKKKLNCSSVLDSSSSSIFGISWSIIGFIYFIGMLFFLLLEGITNSFALCLLGWVNILTLPYIIWSIYYQYFIAKNWCILCLTVQILLLFQFSVVLLGGFLSFHKIADVPIQMFLSLSGLYLLMFVFLTLLIPALKKAKDGRRSEILFRRLKYDSNVFQSILSQQRFIANSANGLGIHLGNTNAKHMITKICNPYCGPCSQTHSILEELLAKNDNLCAQIIYTAKNSEDDIKYKPVRHFLAIASRNNQEILKKSLDDWYLSEKKDYDEFSIQYPIDEDLNLQNEKIIRMHKWCENQNIDRTPIFFFDGYQLPNIYSLSDIKHFIG